MPRKPSQFPASAHPGPGRPRLTPDALQDRIADYCKRHAVAIGDQGLPPFPSGKRETAQHREWMGLYKAHRRLSGRSYGVADTARVLELLTAQRARCPICRKPLELRDARLDAPSGDPQSSSSVDVAVLHASCLELLTLARTVGPEALDRVKSRL